VADVAKYRNDRDVTAKYRGEQGAGGRDRTWVVGEKWLGDGRGRHRLW